MESLSLTPTGQKASRKPAIHFEFLDSFRGLLALGVCFAHYSQVLKNQNSEDMFRLMGRIVNTFSMTGFYLLSSFLLTYRLYSELSKFTLNSRMTLLIITKYFVRRILRIYVPFVCFVIFSYAFTVNVLGFQDGYLNVIKKVPFKVITMQENAGHLASIPPECFYYCLIPPICLLFRIVDTNDPMNIKKITCCVLSASACLYCCNQNVLSVPFAVESTKEKPVISMIDLKRITIFVFLTGSVLGLSWHTIERVEVACMIIKNQFVQFGIWMLSFVVSWHAYNLCYIGHNGGAFMKYSTSAFPWAFFMLIHFLLCSEKRLPSIKSLLEKTHYLKKCGMYSFGMYMHHPSVICLFKQTTFEAKIEQAIGRNLHTVERYGLAICIAYVISALWFRWVEKAMMNLANKIVCKKVSEKFEIGEEFDRMSICLYSGILIFILMSLSDVFRVLIL